MLLFESNCIRVNADGSRVKFQNAQICQAND
jgi:hypothetical protein